MTFNLPLSSVQNMLQFLFSIVSQNYPTEKWSPPTIRLWNDLNSKTQNETGTKISITLESSLLQLLLSCKFITMYYVKAKSLKSRETPLGLIWPYFSTHESLKRSLLQGREKEAKVYIWRSNPTITKHQVPGEYFAQKDLCPKVSHETFTASALKWCAENHGGKDYSISFLLFFPFLYIICIYYLNFS